jgi:uncharacterized protein YdeI (YjbR/CyaY-like superfamily)
MEISETLYVDNREDWRSWLEKNHRSANEIWLIYYKKHSKKTRIPYNDAVEEALCFGWIDSTVKTWNDESYVQRFSPRRKKSNLSEMNKERIRQLIKNGRMTSYGLESIKHHIDGDPEITNHENVFKESDIPADIMKELKADKTVWNHFQQFPEHYKRVRIGWIDSSRSRPEEFRKRLNYFLKMTGKNKMYGMIQ